MTDVPAQAVALFDERPFFEKALQHGVRHGIIAPEKLAAMCQEAPKGMVQIARYFGTEYLRPDLEMARERLVNLVSLYLEHSCGGDLDLAAQSLRDHSLLSRSKGGSDMLKALIAMPQSSHFGMQEHGVFEDKHIPLLARWTLRSLPEYQAERAARSHATTLVDAAVWMAAQLGLDADDLEDAGKDAEAVVRTALLVRACRRSAMPDWAGFEKMVLGLRRKYARPADGQAAQVAQVPISLPKDLPAPFVDAVQSVQASVVQDLPRILDATLGVRKLFDQTPAFLGRYFWSEDAMADLDHFERSNSALWHKATEGHSDDSSLLTLFLCIAAQGKHATLLTEKAAASLVRKIRKSGLDAELPRQFIVQHAPVALRSDYLHLWDAFIAEAEPVLRSDRVQAAADALALLRRECNIVG
ncbi:hypothetical protein [Pseudorhodoferax sp. Leaf274]|uniref:hypothetical protein n=1 Tax=Pseudorhodoferax sp. Leaf274 TaxID=1736318 RepID=UPI000702CB48|nr:hypothetical protein [Pseudorhodoferax sp. Leaf274]KQP37314.1 hypothetical protein ASF44_13170 [Pseudorhodoferax sp. Leaf274]